MQDKPPKWGVVSTIKAPLIEIENFAAHHLELGAHRVLIYLDDADPHAYDTLRKNPKVRVFKADADNWRTNNRPEKHQPRQSANAQHAYKRKVADLEWLAHIDADEFLWPQVPIAEQLQALAPTCQVARVRPIEALSGEGQDIPPNKICFKAMTNERRQRRAETEAIFPTFGPHLNGGFLSHVAGKLFARTGHPDSKFKIHNFAIGEERNPGQVELLRTKLCHLHAKSYADWRRTFEYRLSKGVYRAEMNPNRPRDQGGMNMHELFSYLLENEGENGLRAFYQEVCTATPELRERLKSFNLLHCLDLDLATKRAKHFPETKE